MAFEFVSATDAFPDVLVVDGVAVFGCYLDAAVAEGDGAFLSPARKPSVATSHGRTVSTSPFLELLSVRVVFYPADHEVRQMAVLVREDVDQPVWM